MREVSVRELRELLTTLDSVLASEGELVLTRHGKAIARLIPATKPDRPSHADFRARIPFQVVPSEVLIREDRDARD